jgi:ligand-binding SRPBCC domain-containing protein
MKDFTFSIESEINSTKEILWQHITQMKNVNAELLPYMRMTYPADMSEIGEREVPLQKTLFKSAILLFGFIPIDLHSLRLDKIDIGTAFYENSFSIHMRYWKHTRTIYERNRKTFVRDEVHFTPRISLLGNLLLPFFKMIFRNRHKSLKKHFQLETV